MPETNDALSEREMEILRLVATGAANKEIARQLVISPNTVKVHVRNIFAKIGVASRTEATLYAMKNGIIQPLSNVTAEMAAAIAEPPAGAFTPTQVLEAALDRSTAPLPHEARPAEDGKRRGMPRWTILLAILVLVIAVSAAGARWIIPPAPAVTATQPVVAQSTAPQRWLSQTALPDGRKGMGIIAYENAMYLVGGESASQVDGTLIRYELSSKTWQRLADKPTPVSEIQAAVIGAKIYVPGGRTQDGQSSDHLEVYNPRQDTWEQKAALPETVSGYALATFEGQLYLFGGKNDTAISNKVYVYDPKADRWSTRTAMRTPRAFAGAVVNEDKIYLLGGSDGTQALALNEAYHPAQDGSGEDPWESFTSLPQGRYGSGAAQIAGLIYLLGGYSAPNTLATPNGLQYSIQSNQWGTFDPPPQTIGAFPALLAYGSLLYAFGGETPQGLSATSYSYQAIYTITMPLLQNDRSP